MLILLLSLEAATAQPVILWQNVNAGMTIPELQALRPAARPISSVEKGKWRKGCEISDDKVAVDGVVLDVCYEMEAGKVTAVVLHSALKDHGGAADRFKPALVSKYGAPTLDVCGGFDRMIGHQTCNTVWTAGAVTIKSDRTKLANRHSINLEYRATAPTWR